MQKYHEAKERLVRIECHEMLRQLRRDQQVANSALFVRIRLLLADHPYLRNGSLLSLELVDDHSHHLYKQSHRNQSNAIFVHVKAGNFGVNSKSFGKPQAYLIGRSV